MTTCDFICNSWMGFTFSSLLMGVFIYAGSYITREIIIPLIRDCDWESCNVGKEMVHVEAHCVKYAHNGVGEILQFSDHDDGVLQNRVDEILQLDDRRVGGFNGDEEISLFNNRCVGGFKQNGVEEILLFCDRCVGGFRNNGVEEILQFEDRCIGDFRQNGFEKILQLDNRCVGGFKHNGVEEISQLDDRCFGGVEDSGVEEILQFHDQCFGGFNQDSAEDNTIHSEYHDEDQHISEFNGDGCVEDQELIALDNSEPDAEILDEVCNAEVSIEGRAGSEELVACNDSCGELNASITSGTITVEEEHLEVNGELCFETDYNVEVSTDATKHEKEPGRPASEDMTAQFEENAAEEKAAVEGIADVAENLNIKVEDRNSAEVSIEGRNLIEDLDRNVAERSFVIGETCEIEDKENAFDKMLEELESKELEELCKVRNNDKQVYELMQDLFRNADENNQVCGLLDDHDHDFNSGKVVPGQFKVADRIRDLKHDHVRLQFESVSEETTSKSSGSEQRNSTMSKESELEEFWHNPPVPASLGNGSSTIVISLDALYETYTDRMQHFDMLNNYQMHAVGFYEPKLLQKSRSLRITSSFRQLSSRRKEVDVDEIDYELQKEELETIYVAQTSLTWEALRWQYKTAQKLAAESCVDGEDSLSYDHAAEQFRQFQIMIQRFLENEPCNQGTRIQVYARSRSLMPKLLQVPALKASLPGEDDDDQIQAAVERAPVTTSELMSIMEGAILSFWDFLKADKDIKTSRSRKHQKLMDSTDSTLLHAIKRCLEKKECRLNDLKRRGKYLRKRKPHQRRVEELEILLGHIDVKIISRVLNMSKITNHYLRWCEEKLNALNASQGELHRDYIPVYFPT